MRIPFKLIIVLTLLCQYPQIGQAWGRIGHKTVVEIAERHLSKSARTQLHTLFPDGLVGEACWLDEHRDDKEYSFTGRFHTMAMNHGYIYDPSWRIDQPGGDCVAGLDYVDYCLSHQSELHLTDSALVTNVRILIHVVGDMHCLSHCYVMPETNHWLTKFNGIEMRYHRFFDHITDILYEGLSIKDIAERIDTEGPRARRKAARGTFVDWAQDCCNRDRIIYDINPYGTYDLDPLTVEKARPAIEDALKTAGYRLASLLNIYFDDEK